MSSELPFLLRRRRGLKRLTLRVGKGGKVTVSAPPRLSLSFIENFVKDHDDWIESSKLKIQQREDSDTKEKIKFPSFESSKARAKKLLLERVRYWSKWYGVSFERVSIKRASTRWGSCSTKGNINLQYKLFFLPEEFREYVVVHEVCHLLHMNHSHAFWKEVERSVPNWRIIKRKMKQFSLS